MPEARPLSALRLGAYDSPPATAESSTPQTRRSRLRRAIRDTRDLVPLPIPPQPIPASSTARRSLPPTNPRRRRRRSRSTTPEDVDPTTSTVALDSTPRPRHKRRKLSPSAASSPSILPHRPSIMYGHFGQVVPGALHLELVSCDGGTFTDPRFPSLSLGPENMLRYDKSLYCAQRGLTKPGDNVSVVLRHKDDVAFALEGIYIQGVVEGEGSLTGTLYVAMSLGELRKFIGPPPHARRAEGVRNETAAEASRGDEEGRLVSRRQGGRVNEGESSGVIGRRVARMNTSPPRPVSESFPASSYVGVNPESRNRNATARANRNRNENNATEQLSLAAALRDPEINAVFDSRRRNARRRSASDELEEDGTDDRLTEEDMQRMLTELGRSNERRLQQAREEQPARTSAASPDRVGAAGGVDETRANEDENDDTNPEDHDDENNDDNETRVSHYDPEGEHHHFSDHEPSIPELHSSQEALDYRIHRLRLMRRRLESTRGLTPDESEQLSEIEQLESEIETDRIAGRFHASGEQTATLDARAAAAWQREISYLPSSTAEDYRQRLAAAFGRGGETALGPWYDLDSDSDDNYHDPGGSESADISKFDPVGSSNAETNRPAPLNTDEKPRAPRNEVISTSFQMMLGSEKRVALHFHPLVSGRFILLKLSNPKGNVEVQSVVAMGYGGARYFPAVQMR